MTKRTTTLLGLAFGSVALAASLPLVGCTEATSETNLSLDYVLASDDPAVDNLTGILMRYEDDWLPGTCIGVTRHLELDVDTVRIQWHCRYRTNAGETVDAPIEGALFDPEGDGTYAGTLIVAPLPDINSTVLGPPAPFAYTMTPYVETADGI